MKTFKCLKCGVEYKCVDAVAFRKCEECNEKMIEVNNEKH